MTELLEKYPRGFLHQYFDYILIGEGESILYDLLKAGNIGKKSRTLTVFNRESTPAIIPTPAFNKEELHLYWGKPLTLPVQFSRGCYWNKCAFCSYHTNYNGRYRQTNARAAAELLVELSASYNCYSFECIDDCLSPGFLEKFADYLLSMPHYFRWSASVRFEPAITHLLINKLAQAGCRRLTFGMETTSQRLLDYINKGTRVELYLPILEACKANNIRVHLNWIAGLPTETEEELKATIRFLETYRKLYTYQFGHVFRLEKESLFGRELSFSTITHLSGTESGGRKQTLINLISSLQQSNISVPDFNLLPHQTTSMTIRYDLKTILEAITRNKKEPIKCSKPFHIEFDIKNGFYYKP